MEYNVLPAIRVLQLWKHTHNEFINGRLHIDRFCKDVKRLWRRFLYEKEQISSWGNPFSILLECTNK